MRIFSIVLILMLAVQLLMLGGCDINQGNSKQKEKVDPGLTLEEAQKHSGPGLFIMDGEKFYPVGGISASEQKWVGGGTYNATNKIYETYSHSEYPKIKNTAQLVYIGPARPPNINRITNTGYTIPYLVRLSSSSVEVVRSDRANQNGWLYRDGNKYSQMNGQSPNNFTNRTLPTISEGFRMLSLNKDEQITFARFKGTTWEEQSARANIRFFIVERANSNNRPYDIVTTRNGYFMYRFRSHLNGLYCYNGWRYTSTLTGWDYEPSGLYIIEFVSPEIEQQSE